MIKVFIITITIEKCNLNDWFHKEFYFVGEDPPSAEHIKNRILAHIRNAEDCNHTDNEALKALEIWKKVESKYMNLLFVGNFTTISELRRHPVSGNYGSVSIKTISGPHLTIKKFRFAMSSLLDHILEDRQFDNSKK